MVYSPVYLVTQQEVKLQDLFSVIKAVNMSSACFTVITDCWRPWEAKQPKKVPKVCCLPSVWPAYCMLYSGTRLTGFFHHKYIAASIDGVYFCSDEAPDRQQGLAILRDDSNFQRHLVNISCQRLQQVADRGTYEGPEGQNKEKMFVHCTSMSKWVVLVYKYHIF